MANFLDPLMNFFAEVGSVARITRNPEDNIFDGKRSSRTQAGVPQNPNAQSTTREVTDPPAEDYCITRADAGIMLTYEIVNGRGTGEFVVEDILDHSAAAMRSDFIGIGDRVIEIDEVRLFGKSLAEVNDLLSGRHLSVIVIKLFSINKSKEYSVRMVLRSQRSKLDWSIKGKKASQDPDGFIISPKDPYSPSFTRRSLDVAAEIERDRALRVAAGYAQQQLAVNRAVPKLKSSTASTTPSKIPVSFRFV
jgi:hypothetical protein